LHPIVGQGDRMGWMRYFRGRVVFLWHFVDFKGK
jgi:hypothetical protein